MFKINIFKVQLAILGVLLLLRGMLFAAEYTDASHSRGVYVCNVVGCAKRFVSERDYDNHIKIHKTKADFTCTYHGCTETFVSEKDLKFHQRHHLALVYACTLPGCTEVFKNKMALRYHRQGHLVLDLPFACTHTGCEKRFICKKALDWHRDDCHPEGFACMHPGCTKIFMNKADLYMHRKQHTERFGCEHSWCKAIFARRSAWCRHVRNVHHEDPAVKRCLVSKVQDDDLLKEAVAVDGEQQVTQAQEAIHEQVLLCTIPGCTETFKCQQELQWHWQGHFFKDLPFTCPYPGCGKGFICKQALVCHRMLHGKAFVCWCGAAFTKNYGLTGHKLRMRHGEQAVQEDAAPQDVQGGYLQQEPGVTALPVAMELAVGVEQAQASAQGSGAVECESWQPQLQEAVQLTETPWFEHEESLTETPFEGADPALFEDRPAGSCVF